MLAEITNVRSSTTGPREPLEQNSKEDISEASISGSREPLWFSMGREDHL